LRTSSSRCVTYAEHAQLPVPDVYSYALATALSLLQAAVPKYLKLEMLPPSSTTIPAMSSGAVTQEIRLANSMQGQKNIMLKLKITYKHGGQAVSSFSGAILCPAVNL
jgi:hypothetical protein